jgi:hypothetical protein
MALNSFAKRSVPSSDSDEAMSRKAYRVYGRHCRNSFQMLFVITSVP